MAVQFHRAEVVFARLEAKHGRSKANAIRKLAVTFSDQALKTSGVDLYAVADALMAAAVLVRERADT